MIKLAPTQLDIGICMPNSNVFADEQNSRESVSVKINARFPPKMGEPEIDDLAWNWLSWFSLWNPRRFVNSDFILKLAVWNKVSSINWFELYPHHRGPRQPTYIRKIELLPWWPARRNARNVWIKLLKPQKFYNNCKSTSAISGR